MCRSFGQRVQLIKEGLSVFNYKSLLLIAAKVSPFSHNFQPLGVMARNQSFPRKQQICSGHLVLVVDRNSNQLASKV